MNTDQQVQRDVIDELHGEPSIGSTRLGVTVKAGAQDISVEVRGSDVFLSGSVHTLPEREFARRAAGNTPGVRDVYDNITVTN